MRKLMIAATLFAACGTQSEDPEVGDAGSGSDDGSGSGSGTESGALTIEPSPDFVVDGVRWWTATDSPMVHGTYQGTAASVVQVIVDGTSTPATLHGNTWTVQLPAGSIAPADTWVKVTLTDGSGGLVEVMQLMILDSAAPNIGLQPSKLRDERGDTIDFSTGEPVHTHAGAEIDLAGPSCPAIYKYAYLMDAIAPPYGSQTTPNPLAWKLTITDAKLDPASRAFRVRTDANQVLLGWTALPAPDGEGAHRVELTRSGGAFPIAALGTRTGRFYLDVRARDWNGLEATTSYCFEHHPLAAPVAVQPLQGAELFAMSFASNSTFSQYLNMNSSTGDVVMQTIVQQVAEPITIEWSATGGAIQYTKTFLYDYVIDYTFEPINCPTGTTDTRCRVVADPPHAAPATESGGFTPIYTAVVREASSGEAVCSSSDARVVCQLPPRAPNEAPRAYQVTLRSGRWAAVRPPDLFTYLGEVVGEFTLLGKTYTGIAPFASAGTTCSQIVNNGLGPQCLYQEHHYRISALDRVTLTVAPVAATLKTGASAGELGAAPYVAASALTSSTLAWDSGDDDLPGTY